MPHYELSSCKRCGKPIEVNVASLEVGEAGILKCPTCQDQTTVVRRSESVQTAPPVPVPALAPKPLPVEPEKPATDYSKALVFAAIAACTALAFMPALLNLVCVVGFILLLLIGLPLFFVKRARDFVMFAYAAWVLAFTTGLIRFSFHVVQTIYGTGSAVMGLLCLIIGVVPEAMFAALETGEFKILGMLIAYLVAVHVALYGVLSYQPSASEK